MRIALFFELVLAILNLPDYKAVSNTSINCIGYKWCKFRIAVLRFCRILKPGVILYNCINNRRKNYENK